MKFSSRFVIKGNVLIFRKFIQYRFGPSSRIYMKIYLSRYAPAEKLTARTLTGDLVVEWAH